MYYKDITEKKGQIKLGTDSKVRKTAKTTMSLWCQRKNKEYLLIQPDSSYVNLSNEKDLGHTISIDDWVQEMNQVIELNKNAKEQGYQEDGHEYHSDQSD